MTNAQYHEEEISKRKEKQAAKENEVIKGQKLVTLSTRIAEHDLMTGVKKMLKLLDKQYEVKVVVSGVDDDAITSLEKIYSVIDKNTQMAAKVVQKTNKGHSLRFILIPLREKSVQSNDNSWRDGSKNDKDKGPL